MRILPALLLALAVQAVHAADWRTVSAASKLEFAATFEKAPAPGVFKQFDVRMRFDPTKAEGGALEVAIDVASADMVSADVNKAIAGEEWFDFARFPKAEFRSTDIRNAGGNRYVARGTLSLKGVQQPVEVPFSWNPSADGSAGMDGEFTVKRSAFSIGTGEWKATDVIGPDVKVKFHVVLRKG
jgi:polyisoprenoid-binding protein YceI